MYTIRRCASCGLLWLDPRPLESDLPLLYPPAGEGLPGTGRGRSWFDRPGSIENGGTVLEDLGYPGPSAETALHPHGSLGRFLPGWRERIERTVMHVRGPPEGLLLDVGCGDGAFLSGMRALGWRTLGLEISYEAAAIAHRARSLDVLVGALERLPLSPGSVRVITMHHVLDHLRDPIRALQVCREALAPGGTLVIVSPNGGSAGHRAFGVDWVNLDPPRHLHIFSPSNLRRMVEEAGLHVQRLETSAMRATAVHSLSTAFRRTGHFPSDGSAGRTGPASLWFGLTERALLRIRRDAGEEILLVATR